MKKDYKIFLCENKYELNEESQLQSISTIRVCEIGSRDSQTAGQAYDITFTTNINGTHELEFSLPRYVFDEDTGKQTLNSLIELTVNKSYLELVFNEGEDNEKSYFFVVNERSDKDEDDVISYSYSCSDAYIEELSKTGYGLSFSNEVDGNGLGTIHELTEQVVKGTDWVYKKDKTGTLYEYSTKIKYNKDQGRYDEVKELVPVHPVKYIPEVEQYCYELEVFTGPKVTEDSNGLSEDEKLYRKVYCYDTTEQVSNVSVRNILYNSDDFIDTSGWNFYTVNDTSGKKIVDLGGSITAEKVGDEYLLKVLPTGSDKEWGYLLNTTAASTNTILKASVPYLFTYKGENAEPIVNVKIYDKNPFKFPSAEPIYVSPGTPTEEGGKPWFSSGKYGCIKLSQTVNNPYIVLSYGKIDLNLTSYYKNFSIFEVKGSTNENTLRLYSELTNGRILDPDGAKDKTLLDIMQIPNASDLIDVYTQKYTRYFTRDEYVYKYNEEDGIWEEEKLAEAAVEDKDDDKVTYLDFESEVNTGTYIISGKEMTNFTTKTINRSYSSLDNITSIDPNTIYYLMETNSTGEKVPVDGKYYQYYSLTSKDGATGGAWDYALYGSGANDKRRTLSIEKSNRYNILQELCDLFKVWIVFDVHRNEEGKIEKSFYFKENCIKENFSGFHKGVNLFSFSRNMVSDEIVTKMYVEDQENEYATDGFVTIRRAENLNPMRENYIYNFSHYVNNKLLNGEMIDADLENLKLQVGTLNSQIFDANDKNSSLAIEISNLNSSLKTLATCIASANERITSRQADLTNYEGNMSEADKQEIKDDIARYERIKAQYQSQKEEKEKQLNDEEKGIQVQYDKNNENVAKWQEEKTKAIKEFETKYAQYIKEGVWSDSSYVDHDTYYIDAEKVSQTSSIPKTDWSITVLDGSIVEELQDFQFEVGDQTILVDNDFFGIKENAEENYTFEVLISEIQEKLDNPVENVITVRNYLTSFEDLYERVSAATQTLELNEQTYNKAAYFTNDGQIDKDILQATLDKNKLTLANAADNSYSLGEDGLQFQSLLNSAKKIRVLADGIFISDSINESGEENWKTGITAEGINASLITAGEIDTSVIKIFSKGAPYFIWNDLGITAYEGSYTKDGVSGKYVRNPVDETKFVRLDQFGLYCIEGVAGYGKENGILWWETLSEEDNAAEQRILKDAKFSLTKLGLSIKMGTETGTIRLGYGQSSDGKPEYNRYGLYITDKNDQRVVALQNNGDNQIAGWTINKTDIRWDNGKDSFALKTEDSKDNCLLKFFRDGTGVITGITRDGKLIAQNAEIAGTINATSGSFTGTINATSGVIGGWTIGPDSLVCHKPGVATIRISAGDNPYIDYQGAGGSVQIGRGNVSISGTIYAKDGEFTGQIKATSGEFSRSLTVGGRPLSAWIDGSGNVYNIQAIKGNIGGWTINSSDLSSLNNSMILDGKYGQVWVANPMNPSENVVLGYQLHPSELRDYAGLSFQNTDSIATVRGFLYTKIVKGRVHLCWYANSQEYILAA